MTNAEFNQSFQERILNFVVRVFKFMETLPSGTNKRIITFQLGKSSSSVGANHRAFCRGRSKKEKFSKICIVVEEADETEYWLIFIKKLTLNNDPELDWLLKEIDEIIRIVVSIKNALWQKESVKN